MTAGRLAAAKPAATTNTTLYRCPIDKAASVVLNVCNQGSSAATYRAALRDYDQILTLDSADYSFRKGNVVTGYTLEVLPGIPATEVNPGTVINVSTNKAKFKYHDILKVDDIITYPTKVASIGQISIDSSTQTGVFSIGDTVTGSNTQLEAKIYRIDSDILFLSIDPLSDSDTSAVVSNPLGILIDDYVSTGNEILKITDIVDYGITFDRGEFSTTSSSIVAGTSLTIFRDTLNSTELNLGQNLDDQQQTITVLDSTNIVIGNFISINDEIMVVQSVINNDLIVSRGQFGTSSSSHNDNSVVKIYNFVANTTINFFEFNETLDNGLGASVSLNLNFSSQFQNKFVYNLSGDEFEFTSLIPVDIGRIVRFDQSDSSNLNNALKFSLVPDGIHSNGQEFTTGVTVVETAGNLGSYVEINLSQENIQFNQFIYIYSESAPQFTNNGFLQVDENPKYRKIYLYDIDGVIDINDSFTINNVNYTITQVNSGPYGYVQSIDESELKISLGSGSVLFDEDDTFFDSPRINGDERTLATVDSVVSIDLEDYIVYDKQLSATTVDKNTGIVVGPGQSLMIHSSTGDISYSVNGFEDSTTDYTVIYYNRQTGF
jgi:hypothetical protein